MFGDNIDPQYIHMDMDSRNIAPPQKKPPQHIHIDIDRGNIDLQHMYINRGTIIPSCVGGNFASVYVHVYVLVCQCCLCSCLCARRVNSGSVHVNVYITWR
jgi:hypothetical protein